MKSAKGTSTSSKKVGTAPAIAIIIVAGLGGYFLLSTLTAPAHHDQPAEKGEAAPATAKSAAELPALPPAPTGADAQDCEACRTHRCVGNDLFASCDPLTGTIEHGRAAGKQKREVCVAAVACMRRAACYSDAGDPRACYCGTAEGGACLGGKGNGPCRSELEDASESADPGQVAARWTETQFAIAQAVHEVGCRTGMCRQACLGAFRP